ncbi:NADH-ubiquinone oxidoreductase-F iron-sulfur binding region domain-containing protein [Methanotrichaceae archaeon M04Ac]|uniref:NADH-ubiquinone oxidoreductase-F iron-sulfur binding region domain-containing protein n=1 Tax=Candidatus Methanocrinis alkalitolerans TaxID=3033395 RepID=A0ABT5XBZ1_9EURY|nr:NADH-ubiquinone oxidoreductase-F iron-sulfur binding region domain-containing protein [Candidatus Methanocrinis alkalitolerans]
MPRIASVGELELLRVGLRSRRDANRSREAWIAICAGTGCLALGAKKVIDAFRAELSRRDLETEIVLKETGCPGFCEKGPIVVVYPEGVHYLKVDPKDVSEIVEETVRNGRLVDRLLYVDPVTGEKDVHEEEIPFYKHQTRILINNNIKIDPKNIDDYIAEGGYSALARALSSMTPQEVIDEVKSSGLRGRGGGGFPTGLKWEAAREAEGSPKYVIVNCDEGDPGAFMDRALMEGNPHSVLEGLMIGGYAIGSEEGFIYVRAEYPLAVENARTAIAQARERGLLGEDILGSGFNFEVRLHRGAGAFVSGESTALMNALEGKVGEPKPKYVHTSERGLWSRPSLLNNVETWANIPVIINRGALWFSSIGTEGSKGTKIFSLVGKVNNTGLVEVPMGMTLREIIFDIGGGIPGGKRVKGVQTGGPSGGIIPEGHLDTPVDFDELTRLGSMMGSGSIIVLDEDTCAVDLARYFVDFLCDESCGKCVPCREGLRQMRNILGEIVAGRGKGEDLDALVDIASLMKAASLCALGRTAANPALSTIRHFRDEYLAHIEDQRCPALVCEGLISYFIRPDLCIACGLCEKNCPAGAIYEGEGDEDTFMVIDQSRCTRCGICFHVCPSKVMAVTRTSGRSAPQQVP